MSTRRQVTTVEMVGGDPEVAARAVGAVLQSVRRPLTPAPSEGPVAYGFASGDPSRSLGGTIGVSGDQGRAAPMLPPSPAPSPIAHRYDPATYSNPNHYQFPNNLGGREERTGLAAIPEGEMLAYSHRRDWRRPAPIAPLAVNPGSG